MKITRKQYDALVARARELKQTGLFVCRKGEPTYIVSAQRILWLTYEDEDIVLYADSSPMRSRVVARGPEAVLQFEETAGVHLLSIEFLLNNHACL